MKRFLSAVISVLVLSVLIGNGLYADVKVSQFSGSVLVYQNQIGKNRDGGKGDGGKERGFQIGGAERNFHGNIPWCGQGTGSG